MLPKSVERRPFLSPRTPQKIPPSSIPTIWKLSSRNVAETCASPCGMPRSVRLGCRTMGKRSRSNMSTKYPRAATKTVRLRICDRRCFPGAGMRSYSRYARPACRFPPRELRVDARAKRNENGCQRRRWQPVTFRLPSVRHALKGAPSQNPQVKGAAASIRLVAPAGTSCTATVRASADPSFLRTCT